MQLLHPFMPFITETIWQALPHEGETIMLSKWPEYQDELNFPTEEAQMEMLMESIRAIRNRRAEMNVPPSKKAQVYVVTENAARQEVFTEGEACFLKLAYASALNVSAEAPADAAKMVSVVTGDVQMYLPMNELVDFEKEKARLNKELKKAQKDLDFINKKLNNPGFLNKAPEQVVEGERVKAAKLNDAFQGKTDAKSVADGAAAEAVKTDAAPAAAPAAEATAASDLNGKRVLVLCQGGGTSGLLANALAKAAKERGIDLETAADAYGNHVDMLPDFDLVVLAPQAASYLADLQKDCERVGNKCVACRGKQYIELSQNGDKSLAFVSEQLSK